MKLEVMRRDSVKTDWGIAVVDRPQLLLGPGQQRVPEVAGDPPVTNA